MLSAALSAWDGRVPSPCALSHSLCAALGCTMDGIKKRRSSTLNAGGGSAATQDRGRGSFDLPMTCGSSVAAVVLWEDV